MWGQKNKEKDQMTPADSCKDCRFWRKEDKEEETNSGECRCYPPIPKGKAISELSERGIWPTTKATDWCGKGEKKIDGKATSQEFLR